MARPAAAAPRPRPVGKSIRCCRSTGLAMRDGDARQVTRCRMAGRAPALAREVLRARLGIACHDLLRRKYGRAAKRVVDSLTQEMRQVDDLRVRQVGARRPALRRMSLLQKRPQLAAVPIAQHDHRSNQVWPAVGAAGLRAVTGDAFGDPHVPSAIGRRRIDRRAIGRPDALPRLGRRRLGQQRRQDKGLEGAEHFRVHSRRDRGGNTPRTLPSRSSARPSSTAAPCRRARAAPESRTRSWPGCSTCCRGSAAALP